MRVRPATPADIPQIVEIEHASPTAAHWSNAQYLAIFDPSAPKRVALVMGESQHEREHVIAFVVAHAAAVDWEIENIAVERERRRTGLATELLEEFLDLARASGAERVFLEVRESNIAACKLYEKRGFRQIGRRARYYVNPTEDAVVLQLDFRLPALENA